MRLANPCRQPRTLITKMTLIQKRQSIELSKNGEVLPAVAIGLGWRKRESSGGFLKKLFGGSGFADMDASCISYDADKNPHDFIWFQNLGSKEDSIYHAGDDITFTGNANESNEVINVALGSLSGKISSIVFVINSYAGETFSGIPSVFCNVVDKTTNDEIARYDLSTEGKDGLILPLARA